MTLPRQHVIDLQAQGIFQGLMPKTVSNTWEVRSRTPDYRIDYFVELFDNGQPTGLEFAVQLKGTEKPRIVNKTARFSVETEHLAYWMDTTRHPVFLVVVDVIKKDGWWLFIQQAVKQGKVKKAWRKQKTVTIELPISNNLSDLTLLRKVVSHAVPFMSSLWPGAIIPAIQAEKDRLEALDPRFNVQIHVIDDKITRVITAKGESVPLTYHFEGTDKDEIYKKVILPLQRGEPIILKGVQASVSGSKLFEEALKEAVSIVFQMQGEADAKIRVANGDYLIELMKAKMEGGPKSIRVNCDLSDGLLNIDFESVPREDIEGLASMSFNIRLARYYGKSILTLPYFDQLFRFATAISQGDPLVLEFWKEGNLGVSIPIIVPDKVNFRHLLKYLAPVQRARAVARWLNLTPQLPSDFSQFPAIDIERLFSLMQDGEARLPGERFAVALVVTKCEELSEGVPIGSVPYPIASHSFRVYDAEANIEVEILFTDAIIQKIEPHESPGHCIVTCEGIPGSELVLTHTSDPRAAQRFNV